MNVGTIGHIDHGKTTLAAALAKALANMPQIELKEAKAPRDELQSPRQRKSKGEKRRQRKGRY